MSDTTNDRAKHVAQRAFELWEQQGKPEGRHDETGSRPSAIEHPT
jgi:Protein of unknown function (DUF2934)